MSLIELPRRRCVARTFIEAPPGLQRRVNRALTALGDLPDDLELPGLDDLADALITLADAIDGDANLDPEEDADGEEAALPLFAFTDRARPP